MPAFEAGKSGMNLVEANTVASIISITFSKDQFAIRKRVGNDLGDLPDPVILRGRAYVEDLIVN